MPTSAIVATVFLFIHHHVLPLTLYPLLASQLHLSFKDEALLICGKGVLCKEARSFRDSLAVPHANFASKSTLEWQLSSSYLKKLENVRPMLPFGLKTTEKATESPLFYEGFFGNVCVLTFKIIRIS